MSKTEDVVSDILSFLDGKLTAADEAELKDMLQAHHGLDHEFLSPDAYETNAEKLGMARDRMPRSAVREVQAIETAKRECSAYLDNTALAFDSAAGVYRVALREMGMGAAAIRETAPSSLRGIFQTMRGLQAGRSQGFAMDTAPTNAAAERFLKDFPGAVLPRVRAA